MGRKNTARKTPLQGPKAVEIQIAKPTIALATRQGKAEMERPNEQRGTDNRAQPKEGKSHGIKGPYKTRQGETPTEQEIPPRENPSRMAEVQQKS